MRKYYYSKDVDKTIVLEDGEPISWNFGEPIEDEYGLEARYGEKPNGRPLKAVEWNAVFEAEDGETIVGHFLEVTIEDKDEDSLPYFISLQRVSFNKVKHLTSEQVESGMGLWNKLQYDLKQKGMRLVYNLDRGVMTLVPSYLIDSSKDDEYAIPREEHERLMDEGALSGCMNSSPWFVDDRWGFCLK